MEQHIQDFSDVYTQVLLGVHADLELQSRKVAEYHQEIEALRREVGAQEESRVEEIDGPKREVAAQKRLCMTSIVACALAVVVLGVVLGAIV